MTQHISAPTTDRISCHFSAAVRSLYERYPYPHYPLLAKPRWQEGWLTSSAFNANRAGHMTGFHSGTDEKKILIAGCGEILPAVICAHEPYTYNIDAVDLSSASVWRARFRCASEFLRLRVLQGDVVSWMADRVATYDHIDCYGVLHHLTNPLATLRSLHGALKPGGTARIMVYNTPARSWIHQWQHLFRDLKLVANPDDVRLAITVVKAAARASSELVLLLSQMGLEIFSNHTRFADTFLHPREARIDPASWLAAIERLDFYTPGLYDRYQECDDLPNPLWGFDQNQVLERVASGAFQNNLELFLQKTGGVPFAKQRQWPKFRSIVSSPPRAWAASVETKGIARMTMRSLWVQHLNHLAGRTGQIPNTLIEDLNDDALRRLARMGALLPEQLNAEKREIAANPFIPQVMHSPKQLVNNGVNTPSSELVSAIDSIIYEKKIKPRYRKIVDARLQRALNPPHQYYTE